MTNSAAPPVRAGGPAGSALYSPRVAAMMRVDAGLQAARVVAGAERGRDDVVDDAVGR